MEAPHTDPTWEGAIEQVATDSQVASFLSKITTLCKSQVAIFQADGPSWTSFWQDRRQKNQSYAARRIADIKSEQDFWTIPAQCKDAKNVSSFAQKLLTCYSSVGDVERRHKLTARHRTKYSNREVAGTTEAHCEISSAESSKGRRQQSSRKKCKT